MRSGNIIKKANITRDTLRHYVSLGLITPVKKEENGYHVYTEEDLEKIEFIKGAQRIGFTLSQIEEIYQSLTLTECKHQSMLPLLNGKIEEIDVSIEQLKRVRKHLTQLVEDFNNRDCSVTPTSLHL